VTRYELLDRIGVGGMAEIFRGKAVAAGGFEKPVAIKRILPHLSQDPRFVELLIAEAKVLSLLKHRNIVQIFDVGLGDDGKYFLVMEFVDGKDLGAVQRGLEATRRRMPFDLVLHIGAEICEALEHAHSARAPDGKPMSLVHRDVSPSNVLLSRAGEVKLTDFGIAKRAEQETGHGAVRGKFAYISPEQARNEHLDPRSDVFSVGILLWELVTNRRLYSSLGDLEALRAVREAQVQPPTSVDRQLPRTIDELIMPALAKDPTRRYPSAGEFGAKLRGLRYSLDVTVGDPATELAKIIESAEEVERQSQKHIAPGATGFELDRTEMTAFRIRTADAFSQRDLDGKSISLARAVIDRFEEEETRLAQLSGDQLQMLRNVPFRDSGELTAARARPSDLPGAPFPRKRRQTEESLEPTVAREPLDTGNVPTFDPNAAPPHLAPTHLGPMHLAPAHLDDVPTIDPVNPPRMLDVPPNQRFPPNEDTRLVAPRDRRTPAPERLTPHSPNMGASSPPPMPLPRPPLPGVAPASSDRRNRGPTPGPPLNESAERRHRPPTPGPPLGESAERRRSSGAPPMSESAERRRGGPPPSSSAPMPGPPAMPPDARLRTEQHTPMPGTVHGGHPGSQPPMMAPQPPMMAPQPPMAPPQPPMISPQAQAVMPTTYPVWDGAPPRRGASPGPEMHAGRGSMPQVAGYQKPRKPSAIKPWVLVIGAVVMAVLAFSITRACIHTTNKPAATDKSPSGS
jgi:serine/threonine protein kinase